MAGSSSSAPVTPAMAATSAGVVLQGSPQPGQHTTHRWNGSDWQLVASSTQPAADSPVMAYDSSRDLLVLFGGGVGGTVDRPALVTAGNNQAGRHARPWFGHDLNER